MSENLEEHCVAQFRMNDHRAFREAMVGGLLAAVAAVSSGCSHQATEATALSAAAAPVVQVARPQRQTLNLMIEQPGRVEAFEQTPVYAKIPGYVKDVHVEIGARVRRGDLLAELDVPEVVEDVRQKEGMVTQAGLEIRQSELALLVAVASQTTARSLAREAQAGRKKAQANVERWQSECTRMDAMVKGQVIDVQTRDEARNQCRAAEAAREEADARVLSAEASLAEATAKCAKAESDVAAARNRLLVAQSDQRRSEAMLGYARITAPFDGIVSDRRVHTGHFLQSAAGGSKGEPLFVVVRIDKVRVFVDVPEADAVLVRDGSSGRIRVQVLNDREFEGVVAGTSWSLDPGQRTLRTEIDFPNPERLLRPGMYVHALIGVRRVDAWTVPSAAVIVRDGQTFCYRLDGDRSVRLPVKIGTREGLAVEVLKKQHRPEKPGEKARWENPSGDEQIIVTHPGELNDGQVIRATSK
jgi:HlyD family secretion protein